MIGDAGVRASSSGLLDVHDETSGVRDGRRTNWRSFRIVFKFEELVFQLEVEELLVLLKEEQGSLGRGRLLRWGRITFCGLPVCPQSGGRDVGFAARPTDERTLIVVKSFVQLQMDKLSEALGTLLASKRLFSLVQSHVRLQIGS